MPTKEELSEIRRAAAQKNTTHGLNAFENRGPASLAPSKAAYLNELRDKFKTEPGRLEYRQELAAALAMICELGFSNLRTEAEKGADIWESGVIRRLGVYINSLQRLLDNWPKEDGGPKNIIDVLKGSDNGEED